MEGRPIPPPPTLEEQRETIAEHYDAAVELYGEKRATTDMRKFGVAYSRIHPRSEEVRKAFALCKSRAQWFEVLDKFYAVK